MRDVERSMGSVVLLHGLGRFGGSMGVMARALRREGFRTLAPTYRSRTHGMAEVLDSLASPLRTLAGEVEGPIHLIGHSLGGLVVRALLTAGLVERPGRAVMLGTPQGGSEWADLVRRLRLERFILGRAGPQLVTRRAEAEQALLGGAGHEIGVIAGHRSLDPLFPRLVLPSPHDGKVSVASTRLEGMVDHIVLPVSHTLMVYDRRVVRQASAFLRNGRFDRAA
jgi:alpha-beta hydrolase superfamily lysophospholipase